MLQIVVGGMARVHCREDPKVITILWLSSVAIAGTMERDGDVVAVKCKQKSGFHLQNEMTHKENQTIYFESKET